MKRFSMEVVVCFFCVAVFSVSEPLASFAGREDEASVSHNAGKDCLTSDCHAAGGWKLFSLGGTIYTDSEGAAARVGAQVKVVDANNVTVNLTSDQAGNIYLAQSITGPFTVSVSHRGRTVKMPGAASGGCNANGCHTAGSVGRVYISTKDLDLTGTVVEADTGSSSEIRYRETNGALIARAKIRLSRNGQITYSTTTDATGAFTLKKVKANDYVLKVARKGYKTYAQPYEMKQKDVLPLEISLVRK